MFNVKSMLHFLTEPVILLITIKTHLCTARNDIRLKVFALR